MSAARVLAVDDSAVMRELYTRLLANEAGLTVETAADAKIALDRIRLNAPDALVLDLGLPRLRGEELLELLKAHPIPVIICSGTLTAALATRCLALGALTVLGKPEVAHQPELLKSAVRAALARPAPRPADEAAPRLGARALGGEVVVAIGASVGGTDALRKLLPRLPAASPPILIAQHIGAAFVEPFAQALSRLCAFPVTVARGGEPLRAGHAYLSPGDRHLLLAERGGGLVTALVHSARDAAYRPSANVLLASCARIAGRRSVGVILTGMGDDGAAGLLQLRRAGGATLAQDRASCAVYGMPRAAAELGAAEAIRPLEAMPEAILDAAARLTRNR